MQARAHRVVELTQLVVLEVADVGAPGERRWYVRLLGSNLTDERYRTGSLSVATLWIMSAYGPPRYYGVEFGALFNW